MKEDSLQSVLTTELSESEIAPILKSLEILEVGVPDTSLKAETSAYVRTNLMQQSELSALKLRLSYRLSQLNHKLYDVQAAELEELSIEGVRSSGERYDRSKRNPTINDLTKRIDIVKSIVSYIDSIEWMLKSVMRIIGA